MHHGFRHPEAHMETLTMHVATPTMTAASSTSTTTTFSIPATIPLHPTPEPTKYFECFPAEPLDTQYKAQCYTPIFNHSLINSEIAQSLVPCCYGRLDVVEGCGYQCIFDYAEDHGQYEVELKFATPMKWWSKCLDRSLLPNQTLPENPPANWTLEIGMSMCVSQPKNSMGGGVTMEGRLLAVMIFVGTILPLVML
ncbi:hypothetical protein TWF481_010568 [Arthrobotrys musiformis]|uniref:Uncharacterized protein n=1 Tax=Arthrobotrys musiformis TaxID=47236 RepID=A0AAV9W159_9PEZI